MVKMEYNAVKVEIPESWDDITLGFYESFTNDKPTTSREQVALVAKICKVDADVLLGWPVELFNRIVDLIDFLFKDNPAEPCPKIEIGGIEYVVPIEDEMSLGTWVDVEEVQKTGENVISNILAIVCRPVGESYDYKNNEARRAMFEALPVSKVLPVLAFFLHCKNVLEKRTAAYTKLVQACDQLPRRIKPLQNHGGGIRLLQIWRNIKYYVLMRLLLYRLQQFSRSFSSVKTKTTPIRHKES